MSLMMTRLQYAIYCVFNRNPFKHADWLRKHHIFAKIGKNVRYGPWFIPSDASHIWLHNNITVASNVDFMCHDTINMVISQIPNNPYLEKGKTLKNLQEPIEIFDNVFIGDRSIICPGVHIGPNVVVSAGSVVMKDIPPDSVVNGNPAKIIGRFSVLARIRVIQWEN